MSDNTPTYNMVTEGVGAYNAIAVSFDDDRNAYNALTRLGELGSQRRVGVEGAVVVTRDSKGHVVEKDRLAANDLTTTAGGGLLGLLLGVIGGPLGMLIGGTTGLLVGSLFDVDDAEQTESALAAISSGVRVDRTALVAVVTEPAAEVLDAAMADLGGTVVRRSVADVEAELAAAEQAERAAKREARETLLRERRDQTKASVSQKVQALKARLPAGAA